MARKEHLWLMIIMCGLMASACSSLKKTSNTARSNSQGQFLEGFTTSTAFKAPTVKLKVTSTGTTVESAQLWQFKYAQLLDVPVEKVTNMQLYGFIEDWYGTPYRLGGKNKDGIDCSAFSNTLLTTVFRASSSGTSSQLYQKAKKLNDYQMREGDLVFFKINQNNVSHVGVYLTNDRFVHASTSSGVMISDLNEPYWKKYYAGGGRVE
ncbi:lipoprotein Spr [Chitinophaga sp. CF118]|uniref:C40 family peptidase n=1 Tax=Chitinophaga sp. CF118 TaxID=1884367 RepID=UPI0008E53247|nr:NlpC/P60 family protein [Chitinophaga sp. CF118]SFD81723.1 lipoprotein Spr [Chitinophaga sp. CF118]